MPPVPRLIRPAVRDPNCREDAAHRLFELAARTLPDPCDLKGLKAPVVLLAIERRVPLSSVSPVLERLLREGASYLCFFAPHATALHHHADMIVITTKDSRGRNLDEQRGVICTVGEDGDTLSGAAWFFLNCAVPPRRKHFDYLAVVAGSVDFQSRVRKALLRAVPTMI